MATFALANVAAVAEYVYGGLWRHDFDEISGVAVAPNRRVYVTEYRNNRVQYFTTSGSFLGKWGEVGSGPGQFNYPDGVAVNSTGKVYVAEYGNHRVQYFSLTGSYPRQWGSEGPGEAEFVNAMGVAVAPDRTVFVADSGNHRIQCFTSGGSPDEYIWVYDCSYTDVEPASLGQVKAIFE